MHTRTINHRFTFGDRVRVDSPTQKLSGIGTVVALAVWGENDQLGYYVDLDDDGFAHGGILESEITLIDASEGPIIVEDAH